MIDELDKNVIYKCYYNYSGRCKLCHGCVKTNHQIRLNNVGIVIIK